MDEKKSELTLVFRLAVSNLARHRRKRGPSDDIKAGAGGNAMEG